MSQNVRLVVSIDTEEDNWEPARTGLSVDNIRELPRFAAFCARHGVRVTFFVTYQVASRPWAAAILRDLVDAGIAEIGAHLHPWNTPPFDRPEPPRATMLCHYSVDAQREKLQYLTETIVRHIGVRPTAFRAGRFGLGPSTVRALAAAGYRVDSSVTPFISWARFDDGPSFAGAPLEVYRLGTADVRIPDPTGPLIEVPLSVGYTRFSSRRWRRVAHLLGTASARATHLAGIAARSGFMRRAILSPETNSVRDMTSLSEGLLEGGVAHIHLFFHSSSLRPGLSPFTRSRGDVDRLYGMLERYLENLRRLATVTFATVSEAAYAADARDHVQPVLPRGNGDGQGDGAPSVLRRPPRAQRLLVVNYHFPPDGSVGGLRWAGLSKYLARRGWEVHVLTAGPASRDEVRDGVQVHVRPRRRTVNDVYKSLARWGRRVAGRVSGPTAPPAPAPRRGLLGVLRRELASWLSFPDESRGWMLRAARQARQLIRRFNPDLVVTSGPPHSAHIAGLLATAGSATPLVVDLRDPWSNQSEPWRNDPVFGTTTARLMISRLERRLFEASREVIVNTPELADALGDHYPELRVTWIRNGVDPERLPPPAAAGEALPGLAVTYAGTLYGGRDLRPVLLAFRRFLDRHPDAAVQGSRIRVAGPMESSRPALLEQKIADAGMTGFVEVLGVLPGEDAIRLLSRSTVAVVLAQNQGLQVPAKLYESLGLRVPTLVIAEADSATAREARRLGVAVYAPDDIAGICGLLERVWAGQPPAVEQPLALIHYERLAEAMHLLLTEQAEAPEELMKGTAAARHRHAPSQRSAGDPRANWMWLADPAAWESALELTAGTPALARGMELRFRHVATLDWRGSLSAGLRLPHPERSFDCVAIHGGWAALLGAQPAGPPGSAERAVLRECRRVLRPGGCLYLAVRNPHWYRRLVLRASASDRPRPSAAVRPMLRALRDSGFREVRPYYALPSHDVPRTIIPATGAAVLQYERFATRLSARNALRRGLARSGLHGVLYPSLIYVAYA